MVNLVHSVKLVKSPSILFMAKVVLTRNHTVPSGSFWDKRCT